MWSLQQFKCFLYYLCKWISPRCNLSFQRLKGRRRVTEDPPGIVILLPQLFKLENLNLKVGVVILQNSWKIQNCVRYPSHSVCTIRLYLKLSLRFTLRYCCQIQRFQTVFALTSQIWLKDCLFWKLQSRSIFHYLSLDATLHSTSIV